MAVLATIATLAVIVGIVLAISDVDHRSRRSHLAVIARAVGGKVDANDGVACTHHGVTSRYAFVARGPGSSAEQWTEASAELPRGYPLSLRIVRGYSTPDAVRRGELVDVELGDFEFDHRFIIEAAPSHVVRELIDASVRELLGAYHDAELTTRQSGDRLLVVFAFRGWDERPETVQRLTAGVARIASRVRDAYAAAEPAAGLVDAGSPFRPLPHDGPARAAAQTRERELETVASIAKRRATEGSTYALVAFGLVAAASAAVVLLVTAARACR